MKTEKVLEKFLACKGVLKIQLCGGKNQKVEKSKMVENKYEIRTNLPSTRARRFESDERDLSPAFVTIVRPVLENWTGMNSRPYATSSLMFLWFVWSFDLDREKLLRLLFVWLAQIWC